MNCVSIRIRKAAVLAWIIRCTIRSELHKPHIDMNFVYIYISNLITVQQDATYSVYYISAGRSTCFGC